MSEHSHTLPLPLIVIADDTPSQIKDRVTSICSLLQHAIPPESCFEAAGSLPTEHLDIIWDLTEEISTYLAKAKGRRTLFLLDIVWPDKPKHGLDIATAILHDATLKQKSILLLKSTEVPAHAEEFTLGFVLPLRHLRSGAIHKKGRLRTLAANRKTSLMPYEPGMIAQALLDLQEEALFDALADGELSAMGISNAIEQLTHASYYGAFKNDKTLGDLYRHRVLNRYSQHLDPNYLPGPLNIGIAQVVAPRKNPTTSLEHLRDHLTTKAKPPEAAGLVSALIDYEEVATIERHLFALPLSDETRQGIPASRMRSIPLDRLQKSSEQTWKPDRFGGAAQTIKRRCELSDAQKALGVLESVLNRHIRIKGSPLDKLRQALDARNLPGVLDVKRLVNEVRSAVLANLPEAIAELLETQFELIERALTEGVMPDFKGVSILRGRAELITLDWDFMDPDNLERIGSQAKRVRLLNRRVFNHPAVEAARIMLLETESKESRIVRALEIYCQSPEAIAVLVDLQIEDPTAFKRCVGVLNTTVCNHRLPYNFDDFDKAWAQSGKDRVPLREQLADVTAQHDGPQVTILQMLVAHLALLEYRIRCFCRIITYASETFAWRNSLADNLKDLWGKRRWDKIFSSQSIGADDPEAFASKFSWSDKLIKALLEKDVEVHAYYQQFISYLKKYEIEITGPNDKGKYEAFYKERPPIWLRIGNLTLPFEIMENLDNQDPALLTRKGGIHEFVDLHSTGGGSIEYAEGQDKLKWIHVAAMDADENARQAAKQLLLNEQDYNMSAAEVENLISEYRRIRHLE